MRGVLADRQTVAGGDERRRAALRSGQRGDLQPVRAGAERHSGGDREGRARRRVFSRSCGFML